MELEEKIAKVLQDRDAEMGECATYWDEGHESTRNYYRKSARKAIQTFKEFIESVELPKVPTVMLRTAYTPENWYKIAQRDTLQAILKAITKTRGRLK